MEFHLDEKIRIKNGYFYILYKSFTSLCRFNLRQIFVDFNCCRLDDSLVEAFMGKPKLILKTELYAKNKIIAITILVAPKIHLWYTKMVKN